VSEVIIYQSEDNQTEVEVKFDKDTVWLSQKQMSELFDRDYKTISKHINNVFKEGELNKSSTVAKFATAQTEGEREVFRNIEYYNLDVIISVGYRVKSRRGTQFRIWATKRLKEYLTQGYSINQKRLAQLQQAVELIQLSAQSSELSSQETKGLLDIISNYTQSFILLNRFDSDNLGSDFGEEVTYKIEYAEALKTIDVLKRMLTEQKEAGSLFGNQKDESFKGILSSVVQTFDGKYLYDTIEKQAAHLLYFVIKTHPFSDGNKRIAAFLFIWFLEKNKHRFKKSGELKINDNALVALALLVAQSNPADKDLMIELIVNLIR